jgi:hypothetical protein
MSSEERFTCQNCGGTFTKVWSDEEAAAESLEIFGPIPSEAQATICDGCFRHMIAWLTYIETGQLPQERAT